LERIIPNPDDPIDCAVLDFQQGIRREESFGHIVRRFYAPVRAFLAKRCLSADDCLDLNQETFLKVYTGLDNYAWKAQFSSWLFTIAVNVYRNWRGGEARRERAGLGAPVANDPPAASGEEREPVTIDLRDSPLDGLLSEEQTRVLREAVDELPTKMRRCVELRLQDLDYQEIADEMQLSIGTVKAHLHAARTKLRSRLNGFFDGIDF
jgi:RNA polymerase sigma-70 factor (ECF subfamily)